MHYFPHGQLKSVHLVYLRNSSPHVTSLFKTTHTTSSRSPNLYLFSIFTHFFLIPQEEMIFMHSQGDLLRTLKVHSINLHVLHPGINDVFVEFAKKKKKQEMIILIIPLFSQLRNFPNTRKNISFSRGHNSSYFSTKLSLSPIQKVDCICPGTH